MIKFSNIITFIFSIGMILNQHSALIPVTAGNSPDASQPESAQSVQSIEKFPPLLLPEILARSLAFMLKIQWPSPSFSNLLVTRLLSQRNLLWLPSSLQPHNTDQLV
jgi:hypothetical protein